MLGENPRVLLLVVVGHIRRRHDDGRHRQGRNFADGRCPGPADHQVRRPHHHGHVVNILSHIQLVAARETCLLHLLLHSLPAPSAYGVDVVKGIPVLFFLLKKVQHLPVHGAGPQAAPEGHHQRLVLPYAQSRLGFLMGQVKEVSPHRGPGNGNALRVLVKRPALLKAHHNARGVLFQHFCGQPRDHVGLVYRRGDAPQGGVFYHGIACVASGAHHQVRRKLLENGPRLAPQSQHFPGALAVVPDGLPAHRPLQAAHGNAPIVVARLGHQVPLNALRRSHKENLHRRVLFPHIARQGQGRVHMARRAAAGKDNFHRFLLLSAPGGRDLPGYTQYNAHFK